MNSNRQTTILAGVLIIMGTIAGMLSVVPVIEEADYLVRISAHEDQVIGGAFFQFMMIPAYVGFALCLYPVLRKSNKTLSLGFVGFRLITGMFHFVGVILLPLFLVLSQEFIRAGAPDTSYFHTLGELLRSGRDLVNHVAVIVSLSLGDVLLFLILYQSKFIPRWLSLWGFLGSGMAMFASFLILFRLTEVITPLYLAMNVPLALHSLVLAVWLIAKGFDPAVVLEQDRHNHSVLIQRALPQ